jgi:uncharacterized protein YbbC (DUF1343 family)
MKIAILLLPMLLPLLISCQTGADRVISKQGEIRILSEDDVLCGAERMDQYMETISGKKLALVVNHSSKVNQTHLVDTLRRLGQDISIIFSPEHGYKGHSDAGAIINDAKDKQTGTRIVSLYGKKKKPAAEDLTAVDLVLFDIQDVGVRFYTYISTMHYVMEACAEQDIPILILDRPNPNGYYVDGPVLEPGYSSFVGMHPVPVVHGMTVGEYALMINEEGWLGNELKCDLEVITCLDYDHQSTYILPLKPSPNLPNLRSILLYPSLCFFEATDMSIGRGTNKQFQIIGSPASKIGDYYFTPVPMPGASNPKLNGQECIGIDLSQEKIEDLLKKSSLNLQYLIDFQASNSMKIDRPKFFDKLAGTQTLRQQVLDGYSKDVIRKGWEPALSAYKEMRINYLLYP